MDETMTLERVHQDNGIEITRSSTSTAALAPTDHGNKATQIVVGCALLQLPIWGRSLINRNEQSDHDRISCGIRCLPGTLYFCVPSPRRSECYRYHWHHPECKHAVTSSLPQLKRRSRASSTCRCHSCSGCSQISISTFASMQRLSAYLLPSAASYCLLGAIKFGNSWSHRASFKALAAHSF
jgi:hypothetical protein